MAWRIGGRWAGVETELDATSGAATMLNSAEVRQITAVLRREAVTNLPRDKYNIMTAETVQSMGGAVLTERGPFTQILGHTR
jgi:hypothetical protein